MRQEAFIARSPYYYKFLALTKKRGQALCLAYLYEEAKETGKQLIEASVTEIDQATGYSTTCVLTSFAPYLSGKGRFLPIQMEKRGTQGGKIATTWRVDLEAMRKRIGDN